MTQIDNAGRLSEHGRAVLSDQMARRREKIQFISVVGLIGTGVLGARGSSLVLPVVLSTFTILSCSVILTRRVDHHSSGILLSLGFVYWFSIPAILSVLGEPHLIYIFSSGSRTEPEDVALAAALISLFISVFYLSYASINSSRVSNSMVHHLGSRLAHSSLSLRPGVTIGVVLFSLFLYLATSGFSVAGLYAEFTSGRSGVRVWDAVGVQGTSWRTTARNLALNCLAVTASISLCSGLWQLQRKRLIKALGNIATTGLLLAVILLESGTRQFLLLVLAQGLGFILFLRRDRQSPLTSERRSINRLGVVIILLLLVMGVLISGLVRSERAIVESNFMISVSLTEDNDLLQATTMATAVVRRSGYAVESPMYIAVASLVPSFVWPNKPLSQTVEELTQLRWGVSNDTGGTVFGSIVGQYYVSLGIFGVIFAGILLGWLVRMVDRRLLYCRSPQSLEAIWLLSLPATLVASMRNISGMTLLYPLIMAAILLAYRHYQSSTDPVARR